MSTLFNIILALLILSVIIIFHEFGHFIFARMNGVAVKDFSLGMGPAIVSHTSKKTGTKFCLRVFPIGGYCMMKGEDGEGSGEDEDSFANKGVWQRISIILAGPVFNFILALFFSFLLIGIGGYDPAVVTYVTEDSAAEAAGLQVGDEITKISGKNISIGRDIVNYTYFNKITADDIEVEVKRGDKKITLTLKPGEHGSTRYYMGISYSPDADTASVSVMEDYPADKAGMREGDIITEINGVKIQSGQDLADYFENNPLDGSEMSIKYTRNDKEHEARLTPIWSTSYSMGFGYNTYRYKAKPLQVVKYGFTEVRYWISTTVHSLFYMITGHVHTEDMGGAVRVVSEISNVVEESKSDGIKYVILNLMLWAILLSANLGVMNLLPIPALDGGRLLFLFVELLRGKPIPQEKEAMVHFIGFALLMILMVFILYNDIKNVFFIALPHFPGSL